MRIAILTIGTRGDVQPYVALGRGLVEAGHTVAVCTCQTFESFIVGNGLEYGFVNDELIRFMHTDDMKLAMERTGNLWESVRTGIRLFPKVKPMLRQQLGDLWNAVEGFKPDLILFHPKALGGMDFAERLNVPCMLAFYLPLYNATGEEPALGFPRFPLGGTYNRWTYRMIDRATWWGIGGVVNEWRQAVGLPQRRRRRYLDDWRGRTIPSLYGYSQHVCPRPSDWPEHALVTGYWFLDDESAPTPDAKLVDFLASGDPPVYFGFGSIFGRDPERHVRAIVDACQQVGVRGIIAKGWGGLAADVQLPDRLLAIDKAPHDWLFPQVAAVVHHGGCGTTAAGLRAGRPTLVVPFFGDQPFWADRVFRCGAGPKAIPQTRMNSKRLAAALQEMLESTTIRDQADQIGCSIRGEDGVARAVEAIERFSDDQES